MLKKTYQWSTTSSGKIISGNIEANTRNLAYFYLKEKGIQNITLKRKYCFSLKKLFPKIPARDLMIFFQQLATLLQAGIPIAQCCRFLSVSQENHLLKHMITVIKSDIESGKEFSTSLQAFPKYIDRITYHLIHIGEQTGKLEQILFDISLYQEKKYFLKKKLQQALFYPLMITLVALSVTWMMLVFVVPQFAELFASMHSRLPFFTRAIMAVSAGVKQCDGLIFLSVLGILFFRKKCYRFFLTLPWIHYFFKRTQLARFARTLAITLSAGIPINQALKMLSPTLQDPYFQNIVHLLKENIASGQSLHESMRKTHFFPELVLQLTRVGEESGRLDHMQQKIAAIYESEIEHWVARLSILMEPLIITILGALIGCIVIALYLPIFKLGTVI